jgi:hypothetical protein
MCYLFDVLPTLGKRCGVTGPPTSDGIDFGATLGDATKPARATMIFAYKDVQRAVCDARWKLICYPQVEKTQLFDLQIDPHKVIYLANKPEHAVKVSEQLALLEREVELSGDTGSHTVPNPKPAAWSPTDRVGKGR